MIEQILAILGVIGVIFGLINRRSSAALVKKMRAKEAAEENKKIKDATSLINQRKVRYEKLRRDAGLDKPTK